MRKGVLQRIFSRLLWFTVATLAVPLAVSGLYWEPIWWCYAVPMAAAGAAAWWLQSRPDAREAPRDSLRRREGFLAVVGGWTVIVAFTAVAFYLTGEFDGFAASFFESMSGYTTTGATTLREIEGVHHSVLLQRSFAHWVGGIGIIVMSVAILPELAVGGMQLFSAESSVFESDKLAPRIAATARRLWVLYVGITAVECLLLLAGGMSVFDAINHSMATIATGGFSTKNASIAGFDSLYIEMVVLVFMYVSGLSFVLQYRAIVQAQPGALLRSPEVKLYTAIMLFAILVVTIDVHRAGTYDHPGETLRYTSFQAVSIMTTTGFGTADFDTWPELSRLMMVLLMVIGGCAGSTAGGSKVVRLYVVIQDALAQLKKLVRPRLVTPIAIGDRQVSPQTTEAILGFYLLYIVATVVIGLAMTALGLDLISGTTAAVSAMNSIGPGLGTVGAAEPFADVHAGGMYLLSFGMLLGRLEIYTVLVLFIPHFWRRG